MIDLLSRVDGLFFGMLDGEEQAHVRHLVAAGNAKIVYEGAAGMMGLGKVRALPVPQEAPHE